MTAVDIYFWILALFLLCLVTSKLMSSDKGAALWSVLTVSHLQYGGVGWLVYYIVSSIFPESEITFGLGYVIALLINGIVNSTRNSK